MLLVNLLKSIIGILSLILLFPVFLILRLFNKPVNLSVLEVEQVLVQMSSNEPDEYLWDSFLSVPIKNKKLEKIREQVEILWEYDDFQEQNKNGKWVLNERGLKELSILINELRNLKNT